jgi:hypothetical protein
MAPSVIERRSWVKRILAQQTFGERLADLRELGLEKRFCALP